MFVVISTLEEESANEWNVRSGRSHRLVIFQEIGDPSVARAKVSRHVVTLQSIRKTIEYGFLLEAASHQDSSIGNTDVASHHRLAHREGRRCQQGCFAT